MKHTQRAFTTKRAEWCRHVFMHVPEASAGSKTNRGFTTPSEVQYESHLSYSPSAGGAKSRRGFTLLIATIFMSVMLTFGLSLASLSYKQQVLASSAIQSQYAFYAADGAAECVLYADQQLNLFEHPPIRPSSGPSIPCGGVTSSPTTVVSYDVSQWVLTARLSLDSGKRCADVTIYKPSLTGGGPTYLFSQGYDVSCTIVANPGNARFVSRGLNARY